MNGDPIQVSDRAAPSTAPDDDLLDGNGQSRLKPVVCAAHCNDPGTCAPDCWLRNGGAG